LKSNGCENEKKVRDVIEVGIALYWIDQLKVDSVSLSEKKLRDWWNFKIIKEDWIRRLKWCGGFVSWQWFGRMDDKGIKWYETKRSQIHVYREKMRFNYVYI